MAIGDLPVGKRPAPHIAMLPGFGNDDVVHGILGRDEQLLFRNRRGESGRSGGGEKGGENDVTHG